MSICPRDVKNDILPNTLAGQLLLGQNMCALSGTSAVLQEGHVRFIR